MTTFLHFSESVKKEFLELAEKDGMNYNLWLATGQYNKHGYKCCPYCNTIEKEKSCDCGQLEARLQKELTIYQKYLEKIGDLPLTKGFFLANIISSFLNFFEGPNMQEISQAISDEFNGEKYRGFLLLEKPAYKKKSGEISNYWKGIAYGKNKKQIWVHIGKKEDARRKIDLWLSKPSNLAKLTEKHIDKFGLRTTALVSKEEQKAGEENEKRLKMLEGKQQ